MLFLEYVLDSAAEWHGLLVGLAVGVSIAFAVRFGWDGRAAFVLGVLTGVVGALWYREALVYWPASGHAWYLVVPAALVGAAGAAVALYLAGRDPDRV